MVSGGGGGGGDFALTQVLVCGTKLQFVSKCRNKLAVLGDTPSQERAISSSFVAVCVFLFGLCVVVVIELLFCWELLLGVWWWASNIN